VPWWDRFRKKPQLTADLRERIRRSFDESSADEEHFPSTIDPRIRHVRLILDYFGSLEGKRVLDAGCGKGRFARVLLENNPGARITGMDISTAMLGYVPAGVFRASGSLTELPFRTGAFDCVYATESLEHAVDIETGIAELCRVTAPGGRIVVIDKNAEQFGKLETPPWEKWFGRKQLERLLGRHCREVSSEFISYWEDVAPDGLFVAWRAVR
jgi:ubiquinone/menaquinone biosynthesis C-methylase UbiE